jgi:hypothetical protein
VTNDPQAVIQFSINRKGREEERKDEREGGRRGREERGRYIEYLMGTNDTVLN